MSDAFNGNVMSRLKKIGFEEPWELLLNLPVSYDDYTAPLSNVRQMMAVPSGNSFYGRLKLVGVKDNKKIEAEKRALGHTVSNAKVPYVRVELTDGARTLSAFVFGRVGPWLDLISTHRDKIVYFSGKVEHRDGRTNINNLEVVPPYDQNRIISRYRGKEKVISPVKVAELTHIALIHYVDDVVEHILEALGSDEKTAISQCRLSFPDLRSLLMVLHRPDKQEDLKRALHDARRLNAYYGIRKAMESTLREPNPQARIPVNRTLIADLVKQHPFTPTKDQRQAIWDIICGLDDDTPMDRLLSADVGNGKTMAYGIPAAYVSSQNKNTIILLPTEPLASQVYGNIQAWYPQLKVHLATTGFKGEVNQGDIMVGTTALLPWLKKNPQWKADLAIVDEQQKMGTAQREALNSLGTHVLEATATPIPRTMAHTLFGHKKVSLIDDCPVKKVIHTHLKGNTIDERRKAFDMLVQGLDAGEKVAVIYPLVAEQQACYFHIQTDDAKEAKTIAQLIRKGGVSAKWAKAYDDADLMPIMDELGADVAGGYVAEFHGEADAIARVNRRLTTYLGDYVKQVDFLGSRVDSDMAERNRKTITRNYELWNAKRPGRVAMIHGRSSRKEKAEIIEHMNNNGADVLVSTTLIEIGVDIKNLTRLIVVDAELLGAYALHQLRGRLARNGGVGEFIMMAGRPLGELDESARARLDLLVKFTKGNEIALNDMEQRGFGSLASGAKNQKGFEDGIFPSIKLSPAELDKFLADLAKDLQAAQKPKAQRIDVSSCTP